MQVYNRPQESTPWTGPTSCTTSHTPTSCLRHAPCRHVRPSPAAYRPGAITPLGVRVDRGSGLLGASGTQSTLGEMDGVLSGIRAWKQKHEREMVSKGGATAFQG